MQVTFTAFLLLVVQDVTAQKNEGDSCVEEHTNIVGQCTRPEQCKAAEDDFQLNGIRPTFCEYTFRQVLVCCRDGSSILQAAGDRRAATVWGVAENLADKRRVSERKCEEYSRAVVQKVDYTALLPDPGTMSLSAANCDYTGVELIVGGEDANQGEFPHMAAIGWVDYDDGYTFSCGGSLISSKFVLTAGHCISNPRARYPAPAIVRLGDQNLDPAVKDGANPIEVPIKTIHKHPDYVPPKRYNDIALMELATDVDFENSVRPACLWSRPDFGDHTKAFATGWGSTDPRTNQPAKELQKVSLSLLNNDYCDKLLAGGRNRLWTGFAASQLCAGELRGGKDTCQGDSGSPLQVASSDNQCIFHVIGVTSFGRLCAQSGQPAVYTRVSSYLDWIESVVWPGE
ncbi:unnamed protein product [Parnassius mnemosyne]|uniref:trypsin n=1 Tax=Parnassius mnemosyne TaxID=213953 RepID=A0AAV1L9T7_9NEOP